MNKEINQVCISLRDYGAELTREVSNLLTQSLPTEPVYPIPYQSKDYVSHPDRPWMIGGGCAFVAGAITVLPADSSYARWGILLGAAGIVSLCVGYSKKKSVPGPVEEPSAPTSLSGVKYAEKIIEVTQEIENKWKKCVEVAKDNVQKAINSSGAEENLRQSLLEMTFTTERIHMEVYSYVKRLSEASDSVVIQQIVDEYKNAFEKTIRSVVNSQIEIYNTISQKL